MRARENLATRKGAIDEMLKYVRGLRILELEHPTKREVMRQRRGMNIGFDVAGEFFNV